MQVDHGSSGAGAAAKTFLLAVLCSVGSVAHAGEHALADYVAPFTALSSVHLEARALVVRDAAAGTLRGTGTLSYREQGPLYRLRCQTDDALGLVDDFEWGYDGNQHRGWLIESNRLSVNSSEGDHAPTALPNPLFLALFFLFDRDALGERLELADVAREAQRLALGAEEEVSPSARRITVINHAGIRTTIDLGLQDGTWVPTRMIQGVESEEGDLPTTYEIAIELRDYQRAGALLFPRSISMRAGDLEGSSSVVSIEYTVSLLEVDVPMPAAAFAVVGDAETRWLPGPDR